MFNLLYGLSPESVLPNILSHSLAVLAHSQKNRKEKLFKPTACYQTADRHN